MQATTSRGAARASAIAAAAIIFVASGCQTYRKAPLDLESHRLSWISRSPGSEEVRDLARRLAESRPAQVAAFDPSDGLSLPEAEATALVYNADLRLARLRAAGAAAVAKQAGRWADPVFGFDGERILSSVSHPWIAATSLGVTLPFSGRLDAEKRQACAEERALVARVVADEWALRIRLRSLWLQWSFQALRAELTRTFLDRLDRVAGIAARLEAAAELSRIEARVFRAEQASRNVELRTVDVRAADLVLEIKGLMGLVPGAPLRLEPTTSTGSAPSAAQTVGSPQMDALRASYEVAEEGLRLEIRKQYPDLAIAPGFKEEDGEPRITLGLDVPLAIWNRNQRGIAEAKAKRALARAEFETGYETLVARFAAAELQLRAATDQRLQVEATLVPIVDEQANDVQRVAELGQVNTLVMLDTLVRQHEARLMLVDARLLEALAIVRMQEIAGPKSWGSP